MDTNELLDRGQRVARELNNDFLNGQLGRYFRAKALAWMTNDAVGRNDSGDMTWPETMRANEVRERLGEAYAPGQAEDPSAVRIIDAFMLAQHAGECLLRHCFAVHDAHRLNGVPWQEMARLQGSAAFRTRVREVRDADEDWLTGLVKDLWLPPDIFQSPDKTAPDPEIYVSALQFCRSWARHFARFFLDDSPGYNASKHGLAVVPGFSRLSFALPDEDGSLRENTFLEGAEVRTLEYEWAEDRQRRWRRVTRYVDPPGLIAWTLVAAELLDWLWAIERARHNGEPGVVHIYWSPMPEETVAGHGRSWGYMRVDIGVLPMSNGPEKEGVLDRLGLPPQAGETDAAIGDASDDIPE